LVNDETDIEKLVDGIHKNQVVPIFKVSNVNGEGLDYMKKFLP
jgi:GTPase